MRLGSTSCGDRVDKLRRKSREHHRARVAGIMNRPGGKSADLVLDIRGMSRLGRAAAGSRAASVETEGRDVCVAGWAGGVGGCCPLGSFIVTDLMLDKSNPPALLL